MSPSQPTRRRFWFFLLGLFIIWTLRATIFYAFDTGIADESQRRLYANIVKFVLWVIPAFLYIRLVLNRNPFVYTKLTAPLDLPGLPAALAASVLFFGVVVAVDALILGRPLEALWRASVADWLTAVRLELPSALVEEILFRGLILNQLRVWYGFPRANVLSALLFAAFHVPNWLWVQGPTIDVARDLVAVVALALLLGYIVRKTNSLWPALAVHVVNNVLSVVW